MHTCNCIIIALLMQWRAADSGDEKERDERENQRTKRTNQALPVMERVCKPLVDLFSFVCLVKCSFVCLFFLVTIFYYFL